MKEFDLEKAKAGHPVCTRDGHEARILCFDRIEHHPIVGLVKRLVMKLSFLITRKEDSVTMEENVCGIFS